MSFEGLPKGSCDKSTSFRDSIYFWDPSDPDTPAALIVASAGTIPTQNRGIVVTPERFLVALGANGNGRLVWWSDREDHTFWDETDSTAESGYLELDLAPNRYSAHHKLAPGSTPPRERRLGKPDRIIGWVTESVVHLRQFQCQRRFCLIDHCQISGIAW